MIFNNIYILNEVDEKYTIVCYSCADIQYNSTLQLTIIGCFKQFWVASAVLF